jgi:hypothetical protein
MNPKHLAAPLLTLVLSVQVLGQQPSTQQRQPGGQPAQARQMTVARFYSAMPKDGHVKQLEEGIKNHIAFHRQAGDKSEWHVWTVESGPSIGSYVVGTLGQQWADFEQMELGPKDAADVEASIAPHVQRVTSSIWIFRGDISPAPEGKPSKFAQVTHYVLKAEGTEDFESTVKQINEAMGKVPAEQRGGPPPMLYQLFSGGEGPRFAVVFPRETWGDFAPRGATVMQALQQAFGQQKAQQIMQSGGKAIRYVETEILRHRPDLSSPVPSGTQ